jgi:hypothetical protein
MERVGQGMPMPAVRAGWSLLHITLKPTLGMTLVLTLGSGGDFLPSRNREEIKGVWGKKTFPPKRKTRKSGEAAFRLLAVER